MANTNAMNAMLAHQARVQDDNTYVQSMIGDNLFLGFGTVAKYEDGRVDVSCGGRTFTNVEVMVLGVDGWGIKPVPAENDRVLLLATQSPVPDLKQFEASGTMPAYDPSGLKAIPITDADTAQLVTVDKDGIVITGDNKVTINADGIQVEDKNGNKVVTSSDGINMTDTNSNTIVGDSSGVTINGNLLVKQ